MKTKRLFELFMTVNTKRKFSVQELADEFGVSRRTILRDLQELAEIGVPLYSEVGAHGGYRVLREKTLPPIRFTEDEAVALFFAAQSLGQYLDLPFEESTVSALKKFYHYMPSEAKERIDSLRNRLLFRVPVQHKRTPHLKAYMTAALQQNVIRIVYDSESGASERDVQPIGVYAMGGLWYGPAYCFRSESFRMFRIDRVLDIAPPEQPRQPLDLSKHGLAQWFDYHNRKHEVKLEVRLTPKGVRRCQSDEWVSSDIAVQEDGSGVVLTTVDKQYMDWAVQYFMGFGEDARIVGPDYAVHMMKGKIETLRRLYEGAES
ncbi:helix-turn-helix transcriptional regulator [Paenibacillus koleovorans]|uniref:helix-turn-helix transcriptional regulator n=1 Tax=Paenibacillus koleovorans TaxID=121608 RepID=UPI001FECB5F2|nr:YafY family protein [Paenibacillus koleovorans]